MNPKTARFVLSAWILGFCLMVSLPLRAQVTGATLTGTVTDASGAVIPNAQIRATNTATGVSREAIADSAGFYLIPNLLPGSYDVRVSAKGFSSVVQSNLTLAVGAQQLLNFPMKVGETTQTVQVTEAAPQIELTSSALSGQIEAQEVRELPLNGRDWASLATLSPGVNAVNVQMPFETGARRGNRGFGNQLTISGGKPTQNNYRLDGLSINDYANAGPGSVLGGSLGVDAIQEFSVITGNYSAEYGRASAGVVNAISKSGTNAFHGDIYEFFRNEALDANDFFSNSAGQPKPIYRRNQFGAALGGPIRKDRTFIFGDYEGVRQTQALPTANSKVPSDDARLGILGGTVPAANNGTNPACKTLGGTNGHYLDPKATLCVDDKVTAVANRVAPVPGFPFGYLDLYPHANANVKGNTGRFIFPLIGVIQENFYTTRVDHKISDKDSLFGTYMYDKTPDRNPDPFNNVAIFSQTIRHTVALEETHVFSPALVNSARLGYNRSAVINSLTTAAINPASGDPSLGMFLGRDAPAIFSAGLAQLPNGFPGGTSVHIWNSIQFYDDAFLTRRTHSLKFGFAVERMQYNPTNLYQPNGIVRFGGSLQRFLSNQPSSLEGSFTDRLTGRDYRQTLFGGYVQDDWRVRRNLTLNVGLRYEMVTVLKDANGRMTNLRTLSDPVPYCGTTDLALTNVLGKPGCTGVAPDYSNPTTLDFEPRIGFAWDPRGDGKTSVRGGFAIFDVLPLPGYFFSQSWVPFLLTATVADTKGSLAGTLGVSPSDPSSAYQKLRTPQPGCTSPLGICTFSGAYVDPNLKRNYVQQWNLNVQRQITPSLTATVGYVGSRGVHMVIRGDDFDMVLPTLSSAGWLWPANTTRKDRINPNFGLIRGMSFGTASTYEAAQLNVQKRLSHGFQFGGSYTFGKSMDDDSATILGDAFSNSITTWFPFAPRISRAVSDYNVTHTAVINGIWQVPGPRAGFAQVALGGWELGGILKMSSGIPTTPLIDGDPMGVQNSGSDTFGMPNRVPGCDPINHNYKNTPGLIYINTSCFTLPTVSASSPIAASCNPNSFPKAPTPPSGTIYCSNLLGNSGRNGIVGPSLYNLDFSVYKNFPFKKISESGNVQFRAEFFNVLNRANFGVPVAFTGGSTALIFGEDGSVSGGAGALPQPTVTKPRDIQFALKLIW